MLSHDVGHQHSGSGPQQAIVGVGNLLLKDDGIGIHFINALKKRAMSQDDGLELIDAGTSLPPLPKSLDKLIIVDALQGGESPGTIYRLKPEEVDGNQVYIISPHQIDLWQTLRLMELSKEKPREVIIFGVEPKTIDWGIELSPELKEKVPQLIRLVLQEAGRK